MKKKEYTTNKKRLANRFDVASKSLHNIIMLRSKKQNLMKYMFKQLCDYLENVVLSVCSSWHRWMSGCVSSIGYWHCATSAIGCNPKIYRWAYVLIIVNWWTFQAKIDKLIVWCWKWKAVSVQWGDETMNDGKNIYTQRSNERGVKKNQWTFANTITRKLSEYLTYTHDSNGKW